MLFLFYYPVFFNREKTELFITSPTRAIDESISIGEGIMKIGFQGKPFVVRKIKDCPESNCLAYTTNKGSITAFHIDKFSLENKIGGRWMYLNKGFKIVHLIAPELLEIVYDKREKVLRDYIVGDLLYIDNNKIWGKLEVVSLEEKDFLYIPPGYIYRVFTYEDTCGVMGHINFPENEKVKNKNYNLIKEIDLKLLKDYNEAILF